LTRGKQKTNRGGIWYTSQSGIWQTVWLEVVPESHVSALTLTPLVAEGALEVTVNINPDTPTATKVPEAKVEVFAGNEPVGEATMPPSVPTQIPLRKPVRLWHPDDPFLYDVKVTHGHDTVWSYVGMRSLGSRGQRLLLNGEPHFPVGL